MCAGRSGRRPSSNGQRAWGCRSLRMRCSRGHGSSASFLLIARCARCALIFARRNRVEQGCQGASAREECRCAQRRVCRRRHTQEAQGAATAECRGTAPELQRLRSSRGALSAARLSVKSAAERLCTSAAQLCAAAAMRMLQLLHARLGSRHGAWPRAWPARQHSISTSRALATPLRVQGASAAPLSAALACRRLIYRRHSTLCSSIPSPCSVNAHTRKSSRRRRRRRRRLRCISAAATRAAAAARAAAVKRLSRCHAAAIHCRARRRRRLAAARCAADAAAGARGASL